MPNWEETRYIMACHKQVKTRIVGLLFLAFFFPACLEAVENPEPSARELLELVRANQATQNRELGGKLQTYSSQTKIPEIHFRLYLRGSTLTYQFTDPPPEALVLHMGEKTSRLERITGTGKTQVIAGAKLDDPVRGTDISYEDIALKFLYWNNAIVEKEKESIKMRECWIVRAFSPSKEDSQYDMVRLWIESTGGLLQAECYKNGKLIKRFKVASVQSAKDTGGYILKSMTIQRVDERGNEGKPTRLEFKQD